MAEIICPRCGSPIDPGATECKFCGEKVVQQEPQMQQQPQVVIQQAVPQQSYVSGIDPSWPVKNRVTAGRLAIFLGGFGMHKFYLGKIVQGIIYLCFLWTGIPVIIALIEGMIYLYSSDEKFQLRNHVRTAK